MESTELRLVVQDDRTVRAVFQDGAETSGELKLDNLHRDLIGLFVDWLNQEKITSRRELEVFGTLLYKMLFSGEVGRFLEQKLFEAQRANQRLRIQLTFAEKAADLASIPWEYLYEPEYYFLATNVNLVLSRYIPLATGRQNLAPGESPLRILLVVSKPLDLGPVVSDGVIEPIQKLEEAYPIKIDLLNKPTIDNFLSKVEETKPHVMHFIGHGQFNKAEGKGEIALLDVDERSARWVKDDEFPGFFAHMHSIPRLVFLHLCEGGAIDFRAGYAGLAPQLVLAEVQAVVAMQYPISNDAAIIFSRAFYRELAKGEPVDIAVQNARWRITTSIQNAYDNRVFGTPVLYMRSRDGIIQPVATVTLPSNGS